MPVAAPLLLLAATAVAYPGFEKEIPNGESVIDGGTHYRAVGHPSSEGGARNAFGTLFEQNSKVWNEVVCKADSDGDGYSNGEELGDPECVWTKGATPSRTTGITHPGLRTSHPVGGAGSSDNSKAIVSNSAGQGDATESKVSDATDGAKASEKSVKPGFEGVTDEPSHAQCSSTASVIAAGVAALAVLVF